jgi:hypothetical protein
VTPPTNVNMDSIVYGFERVTGTASISRRMVTERRPSMHPHQKIVSTTSNVILRRLQSALVQVVNERGSDEERLNHTLSDLGRPWSRPRKWSRDV